MKTGCYLIFLSGAFILLLQQSCYVPHYMYSPSAVQVPGLTGKNQLDLGGSVSLHGYDAYTGYALSNHFAIMGSSYWRHERQYDRRYYSTSIFNPSPLRIDSIRYNRKLLSFGLSYFTPLDNKRHFFFTITGGYGAGHLGMVETKRYKQPDADTTYQVDQYEYHSAINNIYLQPSIMFTLQGAKIVFSIRQSEIYFHNINTNYSGGDVNISAVKLYGFTEPALTLLFNPDVDWLTIQLQSGFSIPAQNISFDHRSFIGNIGVSVDPVKWLSKKPSGKMERHSDSN